VQSRTCTLSFLGPNYGGDPAPQLLDKEKHRGTAREAFDWGAITMTISCNHKVPPAHRHVSLCKRGRAADTHEASSARTHPERGGQILSSRFVLWVPHFMPGGATTMPVVDHAGKIIFYAVWRVVKASENVLGSSNWWPSPAPQRPRRRCSDERKC
jgi:hypothetical protein